MAEIIYRSFGGLSIVLNSTDDYVNATALAKRYYEQSGNRKNPADWLRLKRTQETLAFIAEIKGISKDDLVNVIQGGKVPDEQGTFIHPDLAIPFATWLSVEFEYYVTQIVLQRMSDVSRRQVEEELRELINILRIYFEDIEGYGETIHTTSHRQMGQVRAGLKLVEDRLDEIQNNS